MKSFFIPIYLKIGKLVDEKLLVAIIMVTPEKIWVKYSSKRIQFAVQFTNSAFGFLAKEILEQIMNKANEVNQVLGKQNELGLDQQHIFNTDYFDYLKKYSQNTLLFGNTEPINLSNKSFNFNTLYESLMNEKDETNKLSKSNFHTLIKSKLKLAGISDKADIDLKLTPNQISGLYDNTTVTLISKNGGIFATEAIDFSNTIPALSNSLCAFDVLINSLNTFAKAHKFEKSVFNLLISTPEAGSKQEKLFNNIYKYKKDLYNIVQQDGLEEITNKIKQGNYSKFSLNLI